MKIEKSTAPGLDRLHASFAIQSSKMYKSPQVEQFMFEALARFVQMVEPSSLFQSDVLRTAKDHTAMLLRNKSALFESYRDMSIAEVTEDVDQFALPVCLRAEERHVRGMRQGYVEAEGEFLIRSLWLAF